MHCKFMLRFFPQCARPAESTRRTLSGPRVVAIHVVTIHVVAKSNSFMCGVFDDMFMYGACI